MYISPSNIAPSNIAPSMPRCSIQWNLGIRETQGTVKNCPQFWGGLISDRYIAMYWICLGLKWLSLVPRLSLFLRWSSNLFHCIWQYCRDLCLQLLNKGHQTVGFEAAWQRQCTCTFTQNLDPYVYWSLKLTLACVIFFPEPVLLVRKEPTVSRISPLVGVLAGGTNITVTGVGFNTLKPLYLLLNNSRGQYTADSVFS